jgi:Na+/H+ antiporter NhaD/arsenite permease-like protein
VLEGGSQQVLVAGGVFLAAYALIVAERIDRTLVALAGGLLMVILGVLDQDEAFAAIDFNVIFLLAGMMILAQTVARTGLFEAIALWAVRRGGHRPIVLLLVIALVTAGLSAFLDNVTTVVLLAPVAVSVARTLGISPVPFLVALIFASNIGGTATLIGDPPNIMIGSAAGLGFMDFLLNLGPVVVVILVAFAGIMWAAFGKRLRAPGEAFFATLPRDPADAIHDRPLLVRSLVVLALTLAGFLVHDLVQLEVATVALAGATALMLLGRLEVRETLSEIEWPTLFFFFGLFVLVEGIVEVGIVGTIAEEIATAAGGRADVAAMAVLWVSAGASAVVDNIPYTAAAIPIVEDLVAGGLPAEPLWWALALGACLGGNLTIVGASANVVVANVSAREDHPIRFLEFLRYGSVVVLASLAISSVYLWVRYLA